MSTQPSRLLLIEDSPVQARQISTFLQKAGYTVDIAADAEEGLAALELIRFDLILCDLQLPGATGFDVCRHVKASAVHSRIPVIVLTHWADPLNVLRGLEAGADGFISKGQRPREIIERVRRILEHAAQVRVVPSDPTRVVFLNTEFELTASREQLLDVLLAGFEDTVYINEQFEKAMNERLQAQEAEREKDALLRALFNAAVDAIITFDAAGQIQSVNRAGERMFGYDVKELIGQNVARIIPAPETQPYGGFLSSLLPAAQGNPAGVIRELVAQRKDGSTFPIELCISKIEATAGAVYTGFARDITDRRQAQEDLQAFAKELKRSNGDLEQFAYVASHDLKEPLRMVTSFTNLLAEELQGVLTPDAERHLRFASEGAERMRAMIDDLLEYSRVGRGDDAATAVDLNKTLERVGEHLSVALDEAQGTLEVGRLPTVTGNPSLLLRLFQNLIANAIKFRGERAPVVRVSAEQAEGGWQCRVTDNGIGIAPEHQERIFQIFQRLHAREQYEGTGIGLAVCRKIVERHGGRIWVESKPGQGAAFCFTLVEAPAGESTSQARRTQAPAPVLVASGDWVTRAAAPLS